MGIHRECLRDGNYKDPTQIAREFRESGGIIITIEYVQEHGITVPVLQKLASPNFSLTTKKKDGSELHAQELRQLLCEANCFCQKNWVPFNTNKWNAPYGGCYYKSPANAVQLFRKTRASGWGCSIKTTNGLGQTANQ
ncbi:hypothetical protein TELCIR_14351 [Teladorsagia circumcincta]|uniref:Uncharacterized protein n=1 Tax=Teladorsagia circumcincta TaxID=45464 RepID=A0A2G9U2V4_TELCI|nr:hypothetical protein TELCIR_14351 [Teladorsagia circumcincta]